MFKLTGVSKRFGSIRAVADMSFEVNAGEVLGFLGANGAGKSTTMRMMAGYLTPDAGSITVGGHDIQENPIAAKRLMGYLPENAPVYGDMKVEDFLTFVCGLKGKRGTKLTDEVQRVLNVCKLEPVKRQRISTLSKGYTHRTCLAQALLGDPSGLILDEPTDGLDPTQKHDMQKLIQQMGHSKAIIVSTHILDEVEAICTRVIVIEHGHIKLDSPIDAVRGHLYDYFAEEGNA
ncbi:MAG: ABC transporter ATP-binding protein [Victivallales bacterium]|nr:ABC transporter ATP-binding protein [Victivallales bacterium]